MCPSLMPVWWVTLLSYPTNSRKSETICNSGMRGVFLLLINDWWEDLCHFVWKSQREVTEEKERKSGSIWHKCPKTDDRLMDSDQTIYTSLMVGLLPFLFFYLLSCIFFFFFNYVVSIVGGEFLLETRGIDGGMALMVQMHAVLEFMNKFVHWFTPFAVAFPSLHTTVPWGASAFLHFFVFVALCFLQENVI